VCSPERPRVYLFVGEGWVFWGGGGGGGWVFGGVLGGGGGVFDHVKEWDHNPYP